MSYDPLDHQSSQRIEIGDQVGALLRLGADEESIVLEE